jgi:hypothetical protein
MSGGGGSSIGAISGLLSQALSAISGLEQDGSQSGSTQGSDKKHNKHNESKQFQQLLNDLKQAEQQQGGQSQVNNLLQDLKGIDPQLYQQLESALGNTGISS